MSSESPGFGSAAGSERAFDLAATLILIAAGVLFFADPLFSDKNFYFRDILNFHYPLRRILIDTWARGEFPLWNPFISFGQPMLANPNYMAFYPTNLFHLLFSFDYAFKLHFIVHPLVAGPGLYFLQRRLGISPKAALLGAAAYQFSGTLLSFLNLYNILPAVALLPWIGWAFYGALQGKWLRRSMAFGGLLSLQIIAMEPMTFQCTIVLLIGLGVLHIVEAPERRRAIVRVIAAGLSGTCFALGLSAVQILPTLEMLRQGARGAGLDFGLASLWSLHPIDFLNTFVPNLFGNPFSIGYATSWGEAYHNNDLGVLVSFFVGAGTLLLATLSFTSERTKLRRLIMLVAFGGAFLALGRFNPVYHWLYEHVPGFRVGRYPSKCFLLVTLALCILAALGLEALSERSGSRSRRRIAISIAVLGLVLGVALIGAAIHWQVRPEPLISWLRSQIVPQQMAAKAFGEIHAQLLRSLLLAGEFFILGGGLIFLSLFWNRPVLICGLWLALVLGELFPAGLSLAPLMSGADVDFVPEVDRFVLAQNAGRPFRVVAPDWLPVIVNRLHAPNRSLAWLTLYYRMTSQTMGGIPRGIQYSLGFSVDLLNTADSEELYTRCLLLPEANRVKLMEKLNSPIVLSIGPVSHPDLVFLASFDTMSDYRLYAYRLVDSLPRAYLASRILRAPSHSGALDLLVRPDVSLHDTVILEDAPESQTGDGIAGSASILEYSSRRVLLETVSGAPEFLVLLDSYYPGWSAFVDGNEVAIRRANYAFRAIPVPAGKHRVEFVYKPRLFFTGLGITLLAAAFGLGWSLVQKGRERS